MSLLIGSLDEGYQTFREYFINEALKPQITDYGTNTPLFDNRKTIMSTNGKIQNTFFTYDDKIYVVQKSKDNELAFGVSATIPKTDSELLKLTFTDNKIMSKSAINVFNKVFYVLLEIIKNDTLPFYFFNPANEVLNSFYSNIFKNKSFNTELNKLGYQTRQNNNMFFINKIQ